jgi:nitrogen regulatory protein PII
MKIVLIVYNVALHRDVIEMLRQHGVETYSRWEHVTGVGKSSGPHLDTNVWPARNSAIVTATADELATALLEAVREMRKNLAAEGIKAFVMPLDDMT